MSRPTKLKLAAYGVLLLTLFLPFSRCSHGTPAPGSTPANPTSESSVAGTLAIPSVPSAPPQAPATPPIPASVSPWYHLFERNTPEADYKYGMDLLIESWAVPTTLPKEFDPVMLVPGRMFYVWPLAALALAVWWPPIRWRRSFHAIEAVLALGGIWWAILAVVMNQAMRGFYIAVAALALYALTALCEWIMEWRRLRWERRGGPLAPA